MGGVEGPGRSVDSLGQIGDAPAGLPDVPDEDIQAIADEADAADEARAAGDVEQAESGALADVMLANTDAFDAAEQTVYEQFSSEIMGLAQEDMEGIHSLRERIEQSELEPSEQIPLLEALEALEGGETVDIPSVDQVTPEADPEVADEEEEEQEDDEIQDILNGDFNALLKSYWDDFDPKAYLSNFIKELKDALNLDDPRESNEESEEESTQVELASDTSLADFVEGLPEGEDILYQIDEEEGWITFDLKNVDSEDLPDNLRMQVSSDLIDDFKGEDGLIDSGSELFSNVPADTLAVIETGDGSDWENADPELIADAFLHSEEDAEETEDVDDSDEEEED